MGHIGRAERAGANHRPRAQVSLHAGDHLSAVGELLELAGAGTEPLSGDPHRRHRAVAGRQGSEQRSPGRSGQFHRDVPSPGRHALQQPHHGGCRIGQHAVSRPDHAEAGGHGTGPHLVDAEHLQSGRRPNHVDDRVVPPHLVEVDLVHRAPVQAGLHLR